MNLSSALDYMNLSWTSDIIIERDSEFPPNLVLVESNIKVKCVQLTKDRSVSSRIIPEHCVVIILFDVISFKLLKTTRCHSSHNSNINYSTTLHDNISNNSK